MLSTRTRNQKLEIKYSITIIFFTHGTSMVPLNVLCVNAKTSCVNHIYARQDLAMEASYYPLYWLHYKPQYYYAGKCIDNYIAM